MAKDPEAKVTFKAFNKDFNKAITEMNQETGKLRQEMKLQSEQLKHTAGDTEKFGSALSGLEKQQEIANKKTEETVAQLEKAKAQWGENSVEAGKLEAQLKRSEIAEQQIANKISETTVKLNEAKQADIERAKATSDSAVKLDELKNKEEELKVATEKTTAEYELQKAKLGENATETEKLALKVDHLKNSHAQAGESVKNHEKQLEQAKAQYGESSTEVDKYEKELLEAKTAEQELANEIVKTNEELKKQGGVLGETGKKLEEVGGKMSSAGKTLSTSVTAPIVAVGAASFKAASDYESAFAGVRKTTDATEAEFKELSDGIRDMAKEMPAAATEIASVAEVAGQLGIKKENILQFTETMVKMGVATNMTSEEAATDLARLANITQMPMENINKLGSSVVDLGNNLATTEGEIVSMSLRLAGAGAQIGMSEADILGLAGALSSVGIEAEMGGSAISRVMVSMQVATSAGFTKVNDLMKKTGMSLRDLQMMASHDGKAFGNLAESLGMTKKELNALLKSGVDLKNFSEIAGMTTSEFKQAFEKDAVGAIGAFINGLGSAEEAGESAIEMLQEMGITEIRLRDSLLRAGGASKLFADSVDLSNKAWDENTALTKEAEERYKTVAAQMQIMWNKIKDVGITIGEVLIPIVIQLMDALGPIISIIGGLANLFSMLPSPIQNIALVIVALVAAIGPLLWIIGTLITSIGSIMGLFGGWSAIMTTIAPIITGVKVAFAALAGPMGLIGPILTGIKLAFAALTGPIGLIVIATIAAVALIIKYWEPISDFFIKLWDQIKEVWTATVDFLVKVWEPIGQFFINLWTGITDVASSVWDAVVTAWTATVEFLKGIWASVSSFFADLWAGIVGGALAIWNAVTTAWTTTVDFLKGIWGSISSFFADLWTGIVNDVLTSVENIKNNTLNVFTSMKDGLSQFFDGFGQFFAGAWELIKNIFAGALLLLINLVTADFDEMRSNALAIFENIKNALSEMWQGIVNMFQGAISAIVGFATSSWEILKNGTIYIFNSVKDFLINTWENTKQFLSDALTFIVNSFKTGWENLKNNTVSIFNSTKEFLVNTGESIKNFFINLIPNIVNSFKTGWTNLKNNTVSVFNSTKELIFNVWNSVRIFFANLIPNIVSTVTTKFGEMKSGVSNKMKEAKEAIVNIWNTVMSFFKNINLLQIGKDIIQGLINGIKNKVEAIKKAVTDVTDAITGKLKSILNIQSPSRVMMEMGGFIGEGLAIGIDSTKGKNEKAIAGLGDAIKGATVKNANEVLEITQTLEAERNAIIEDAAKARLDIQKKSSEDIANAISKASDKNKANKEKDAKANEPKKTAKGKTIVKPKVVTATVSAKDTVSKINKDASAKLLKLKDDERKKLAKLDIKMAADIKKKQLEITKDKLDAIKLYVEDKKSIEELSMLEEVAIWKHAEKEFKKGTKERVEVQKQYQKSLKTINDNMLRVNNEYTNKAIAINDKLKKSEQDLNKEYEDALEKREGSLRNSTGLFGVFDSEIKDSGDQLLLNLDNQVEGFKLWQSQINKLSSSGIDSGLINELRELGPNALPELKALNSLTKEQLTNYSNLYKEKSSIARTQAEEELKGMKLDTEKNIRELKKTARNELSALQVEWVDQIKLVTKSTDDELQSLEQIGKDAGQGLINGLASMEGSLITQSQRMADSVSKTIKDVLQIASPSKLLTKMGEFTGEGFADGIENMIADVKEKAKDLANAAIPKLGNNFSVEAPQPKANLFENRGPSQTVEHIYNYEKMLSGAVFHVREEADVKKVAVELFNMEKRANRGRGIT